VFRSIKRTVAFTAPQPVFISINLLPLAVHITT